MKYSLLLVLCSAISFNTAAVLTNSVEESYWRDYRSLIPSDALAAGTTQHGQTTYIGQMSIAIPGNNEANGIHKIDVIPAVVTHRNQTVVGAYQGRAITSNGNSNVKVLCTQYSRRYVWHTEPAVLSPGCRYVVAGQEDMVPLNIGRAVYNRQTVFGKVFSDGRHGKTLFAPYEDGQLALQSYATLTYCY